MFLCFGLATTPQTIASVCSGFRDGSRKRDLTFVVSGQLVGDHRVSSSLASASRATPSALQGPGCCHQHGEVTPRAFQQSSVSQDANSLHLREGHPDELSNCKISVLGR